MMAQRSPRLEGSDRGPWLVDRDDSAVAWRTVEYKKGHGSSVHRASIDETREWVQFELKCPAQ